MEWRLFPEGTIPEYTTPEWYAGRETAPHLEQPGHRERLLATAEEIKRYSPHTVVDLGAGDGGLLSVLQAEGIRCWGYDLQQTNVDVAVNQRGVDVRLFDVVKNVDQLEKSNDVMVCTEMLEHLVDPHGFVKKLSEKAMGVLIASSPWHETDQNHYEFHTWAWDMEGYKKMFEDAGFMVGNHFIVQGAQILVAV
jgi:2-polyprenyl-3-methyl-5-hydroxy-6-metoxy-1,4-benzoquinol methylase